MPNPLALLRTCTPRCLALGVFGVAVLALGLAYVSEYVFGLHPCEMCYWQRVPFGVLIVLGLAAYFVPKIARPLLWLAALVLLVSAALGAFHAGVEWKWWEGPSACSGGVRAGMTAEEILRHIRQAAVVSCTDAAVRVLGLSMAGWNALYSLGAALALLFALKQPKG